MDSEQAPPVPRATLTIERPGELNRWELAAWLQEQADYIFSQDHEERGAAAARYLAHFPPDLTPDPGD